MAEIVLNVELREKNISRLRRDAETEFGRYGGREV